jgi:hypothetical protein
VTKFQIKVKSKPISAFFDKDETPYKRPSSFFLLGVGYFRIFQHFLYSFPQRVSEDINSIHIQFHVKITFAKKNLVTIQKYEMRVITKKVAIVKK